MEKKGYGIGKRTKREIGTPLMVINIKQEIIDILHLMCFFSLSYLPMQKRSVNC